jgi:hypothetical protein
LASTGLAAGVSQTEITPPAAAPLLGCLTANTGTHDPLFAQTLVLSDGTERAAIVCLDLVGMDFGTADEIRGRIERRCGIATTLLACSHTHSAPFTIPWSVQGWQWLAGEGRAWRERLIETVTEAVGRAAGNMRPVALRTGRAPAHVGLNRRLPTPQGTVMKPNPEGAAVPWVDVLRVDALDGKPLAILLSHAAHPVIVHGASTLASADYPGFAVAEVRKRFGSGTAAMFAQACGGKYQLWIDQNSPFRHTMVLAYTNGCESYVPTDKDFPLGGYEATASPAPSAALRYPRRVALRPGIERLIQQQIQALWSDTTGTSRGVTPCQP